MFFVLFPGNCSRWKVFVYVLCFVSWQLFSLEGFSLGFLFCVLATVLVGRFLSRFFVLFPGNCSRWKVSIYVLCFVSWQLFSLEGFYLCSLFCSLATVRFGRFLSMFRFCFLAPVLVDLCKVVCSSRCILNCFSKLVFVTGNMSIGYTRTISLRCVSYVRTCIFERNIKHPCYAMASDC